MLVGEAEVLVVPQMSMFRKEMEAGAAPALGSFEKKAEESGVRAGTGMSRGFGRGTHGITSVLASLGLPLGTFGGHLEKTAASMGKVEASGSGMMHSLAGIGGGVLAGATAAIGTFGAASVAVAVKGEEVTTSIANSAKISTDAAKEISSAFADTMGHLMVSGQELGKSYAGVAGVLGQLNGKALSSAQALGVMTSAADLADGGQISLESSTQDLTKILQAYHLQIGESSKASDVLYSTSRLTGVGIDQLTTTLTRVRGKLGDLAPSLQESASLVAALAKNGVTGRQSMATLNGAFTTLVGGGKKTQEMAKALGISIFDQTGKFVGMRSIIEQLQPKLAGLSQQTQLQATKALFGSAANKQMIDIVNQGPSAFDKSTSAVTKSGAAHDAAKKQAETFSGQIKVLKATAIDLAEKFGNILIPKIVWLGKAIADSIGWLTKHKAAATALAVTITTVLGAAITAFVVQKAVAFGRGIATMIASMGKLVSSIQAGVAKIIGYFTAESGAAEAAASTVGAAEATMAGEVTAADTAIEGANAAATASFRALGLGAVKYLGLIGVAVVAAETALHGLGSALESITGEKQAKSIGELFGGTNEHTDEGEKSLNAWLKAHRPSAYEKAHPGGSLGTLEGASSFGAIPTAAAIYKVPEAVLRYIWSKETSSGRNVTTSSAGAMGDFQFIPETAKQYHYPMTNKPTNKQFAEQANATAHYISDLIKRNHGNIDAAVRQYSGGGYGYSGAHSHATERDTHAIQKHNAALEKAVAALGEHTKAAAKHTAAHHAATRLFTPHGGSTGFFEAPGTNYRKGREEEIAYRLDMLAKAEKIRLTGISGYRTPAHSMAVGGFANDPHTKGLASDTLGAERISEAALRKFGLTRPFSGAKEANHIQLLPGVQALVKGGKMVGEGGLELKKQRAVIEAIVKAEEKRRSADLKAGQSEQSKIVGAIHAGGVKELTAVVGGKHEAGFKKLIMTLHEDGTAASEKLRKGLEAVHKKALEALAKAIKDAEIKSAVAKAQHDDVINTQIAENAATQIADSTKVTLDHAAEQGLSGAALAAAQAQTNVDAVKEANDIAIGQAKLAVDQAEGKGELSEEQAHRQLVNAENTAKVSEAQALQTLDLANNAASEAAKAEEKIAEEKNTKAIEENTTALKENENSMTGSPVSFTILGHGLDAGEIFADIGWAFKVGALGPPPATVVPVAA